MTDAAAYPSLRDRTVFVTGGAAGIGAAMVRAFAGQGARVAFVDIDEAAGAALAGELGDAPGGVRFDACDVRDVEALGHVIERVGAELGPVTVLVNNAAHDERHAVDDVTPAYWRDRLAVNLDHAFFASQAVRGGMRAAGGGAIVNFGSTNWLVGGSGMIAYQSAKAAMHGLTKGLARELGPDRIRVNCILPGWVMTERQKALWLDEAGERLMDERQSLPGRVQPEDVADAALFLASEQARMVSGQFFVVDGGWS